MIDKFESPIEQLVYPIIYTISIKYNLKFQYQMKIGYQSGSSMTQEEYFEQKGWNFTYKSRDYYWDDNYWECELYRIDFTLESSKIKIAIELDGEQFHKNKYHDKQKDEYLQNRGYTVLRFTGKDIIKNINKMREQIINLIIQKEFGFDIEKQKQPIIKKIIPKHTLDYHIKELT